MIRSHVFPRILLAVLLLSPLADGASSSARAAEAADSLPTVADHSSNESWVSGPEGSALSSALGWDASSPAIEVPWYAVDPYHGEWCFHLLPQSLIYRSYLAGPKESRLATSLVRIPDDSTLWDATLGARIGLFRFGTADPIRPRGFQVDVEASAQVRLDTLSNVDVRGADYRVGIPFTWGDERRQWKFAYYHMSSHLGDEFMEQNGAFPLFRQSRDALVLGHSFYVTDSLRLYGEVGWAFASTASEPWELQFGIDYAPRRPTGLCGAPFLAINGHLREEHDYGGGLTAQLGWAWRADRTARLLRAGFQYYNGLSTQYAFLPFHEQQYAIGIWYDF
jgi:hypothetical protein